MLAGLLVSGFHLVTVYVQLHEYGRSTASQLLTGGGVSGSVRSRRSSAASGRPAPEPQQPRHTHRSADNPAAPDVDDDDDDDDYRHPAAAASRHRRRRRGVPDPQVALPPSAAQMRVFRQAAISSDAEECSEIGK